MNFVKNNYALLFESQEAQTNIGRRGNVVFKLRFQNGIEKFKFITHQFFASISGTCPRGPSRSRWSRRSSMTTWSLKQEISKNPRARLRRDRKWIIYESYIMIAWISNIKKLYERESQSLVNLAYQLELKDVNGGQLLIQSTCSDRSIVTLSQMLTNWRLISVLPWKLTYIKQKLMLASELINNWATSTSGSHNWSTKLTIIL